MLSPIEMVDSVCLVSIRSKDLVVGSLSGERNQKGDTLGSLCAVIYTVAVEQDSGSVITHANCLQLLAMSLQSTNSSREHI